MTRNPDRCGALVLTSGDALEHFLPWKVRYLQWAAHVPGSAFLVGKSLKSAGLRRSWLGSGPLTKRGIPAQVSAEYVRMLSVDRGIRRDLTRVLRGVSTRYLMVAAQLFTYSRPVLILWAEDDVLFPLEDARRLQRAFPDATLELVPDSRTYLPEDQPAQLVASIRKFLGVAP